MTRQPHVRRRRRPVAVVGAILVGLLLFILGLDLIDMFLLVLASFYAYWVLRID